MLSTSAIATSRPVVVAYQSNLSKTSFSFSTDVYFKCVKRKFFFTLVPSNVCFLLIKFDICPLGSKRTITKFVGDVVRLPGHMAAERTLNDASRCEAVWLRKHSSTASQKYDVRML